MSFHVLVPLDGSEPSRSAQRVAFQFAAARPDIVLIGLHVVNVRPGQGNLIRDLAGHLGFEPAVVTPQVAEDKLEEGRKIVEGFLAEAQAAGVTARGQVEIGGVASTIIEYGEGVDLVVMGLRGRTEERFSGQGGEMIGWLPSRLSTPILFLPSGIQQVNRLVIGFDGSAGAHHCLRTLRALGKALAFPIDAIFVSADGQGGEVLDQVDAELPDRQVVHHVVTGTQPHETLATKARILGAQVIALGFGGRSRLRDILWGTATERAVIDGRIGVLICH